MYNNNFLNYPQPNNGINWVQGLEGAKAFPLTPNAMTVLLDNQNDGIFYIKICDNIGMAQIRKFKYQEIIEEPQAQNQYVTRDELIQMLKEIRNEQTISTTDKSSVKSESNDEHAKTNK